MQETPKVSIITPSYCQGSFIRTTIESVLQQDYANIQYIVVDGASTDETVDILKQYEGLLTWISEPDEGQTDAINKGIRMADGDIIAYLNSDDIYLPGTISRVVREFNSHPEVEFLYGDFHAIDERGDLLCKMKTIPFDHNILLYDANYISQPASFYRYSLFENIGMFDAKLQYLMDYEFFLRAAKRKIKFRLVRHYLSAIRYHGDCKTLTGKTPWAEERRNLKLIYAREKTLHPSALKILGIIYCIKRYALLISRGKIDFLNLRLSYKQRLITQKPHD